MAGPRATVLRVTWLYISPDVGSQKVEKVQIGREMVVAEKNGAWMRVFANTDIEEQHNDRDTPMVGEDTTPPAGLRMGWKPRGSWKKRRPVVTRFLWAQPPNQEVLATNPRGPATRCTKCGLAVSPRC